MAAEIKLLIDEDTHLALAGALRKRGHDAVHVREAGRLGVSDDEQLKYSAAQERCFVTFNVGEFVVLHGEYAKSGREHFGVVVSPRNPSGECCETCSRSCKATRLTRFGDNFSFCRHQWKR